MVSNVYGDAGEGRDYPYWFSIDGDELADVIAEGIRRAFATTPSEVDSTPPATPPGHHPNGPSGQ
jgi:hypothetical protein